MIEIFLICFMIVLGIAMLLAAMDLLHFLIYKERLIGSRFFVMVEVVCVGLAPLLFLLYFDVGKINDCCNETAIFSPNYRLTVYVVILLSAVAYFYSSWRSNLSSPFVELLVNCFLLIGIILNILLIVHLESPGVNISILALFLTTLLKNHNLLLKETNLFNEQKNGFRKICSAILRWRFFIKFPILLLFCVPFLLMLALILFVFGQQPDSAIQAFTQTYKHGLSQLDFMCDNVQCGGHYLCSIAANGHPNIVKPERYGERNGGRIICNRQLLISNAFEELIEQKFPRLHSLVRRKYDRVGDLVHRHYYLFQNKFFSDCIYILMKPPEWFFLLTLYLADRKPENRIARQYLSTIDKWAIKNEMQK